MTSYSIGDEVTVTGVIIDRSKIDPEWLYVSLENGTYVWLNEDECHLAPAVTIPGPDGEPNQLVPLSWGFEDLTAVWDA